MKILALLLFVLHPCAILRAQPATTQVQGPIYNQDGSLFNGSLTISLASGGSIASGGYTVLRSLPRKLIVNGVIQGGLSLVPNDLATPANTSYIFQFSNGSALTCSIPTSGSPITLAPYCVPGAPFTPTPVVPLAYLNVNGTPNGNYCITVANGKVVGLTACSGGSGGSLFDSASGLFDSASGLFDAH